MKKLGFKLACWVMVAWCVGVWGGAEAQSLLPNGQQQFSDSNGAPLAGGSVYFYVPGTTTAKYTYQDPGETVPNTNPIILNSAGRAIIWGTGEYREVVYDQFGTLIWDQITYGASRPDTNSAPGLHSVVLATSGNFTIPLGATTGTEFRFRVVGGGGQGGGVAAVANASSGGGESGAYGEVVLSGFNPGDVITVAIGAHGSGAGAGADGNDGGDTTLVYQGHTIVTAAGGEGGTAATGLGVFAGGHGGGGFGIDLTGTSLTEISALIVGTGYGSPGRGQATYPVPGVGGSDPLGQGIIWQPTSFGGATNNYGAGSPGFPGTGTAQPGYDLGGDGVVIVDYSL